MFDLSVVWSYRADLLAGLWVTCWISLVSIGIGFCIGATTCLARMSKNTLISAIASFYISVFRGTPLLVQLGVIFFFLPMLGVDIPPVLAAIISLSLNSGAFQSEILRGGFQTLPRGQVEAAWDIGLTNWQCFYHIELVQVLRKTVPALVNEVVDIIKNSSLISTISVSELMRVAQQYSSTTYRPLEFFVAAGALYLLLTLSASMVGYWVERRLSRHQES